MKGVAAIVVTAIIFGTLYFGREVFVPIALAILLSFVLAPMVRLLQRWHIPRGLSVISVVLLAFMSIFALGGVIATQLTELAGDLPRYQFTMREKIMSLRGATATSGTLERAADVLQDLGKELNKPKDPSPIPTTPFQSPARGQEVKPIPVEVRQPPPTALENIAALISPLLHPLTTTGIIAIFVIFILFQREDLRNRFIKLAGSHDLQKTTAALDDATTRLSRLFLILTRAKYRFRCSDRRGLVDDRSSKSSALGHPRRSSPLCAVYRRGHLGCVSPDARGGGGSGLVNATVDGRSLSGGRASAGSRYRTVVVWA